MAKITLPDGGVITLPEGGQPAPKPGKAARPDVTGEFADFFSRPMEGMQKTATTDELTRIFSTINEDWLAPTVGGLVDLVADPVYAGINKLFGTNLDSDLTGVVREGMRSVGASGGPDYKPQTELGQLAADAAGAVGAALPFIGGASALANKASGPLARAVLAAFGDAPAQQIAGAAGAGVGKYAANEMAPGSVFAELAGMLGGAALGGGIAAKVAPDDIVAAFDRQKVPISAGLTAGDTKGGRALSMLESAGLGTTIGGSGIVRNTYDDAIKSTGVAVDDLARTLGTPQSADDAGRVLQESVGRFMDDKAAEANKAFDAVGRFFGPDDTFVPKAALRALGQSFDDIDDPALQAIARDPRFQKYASAFLDETGAPKALSYNTLKGFRTYVGRQMNKLTLDGGADNAQLKALYSALTEDMERALLAKGGQKALDVFRDANAWYARQMEIARNNLQPLVGRGQAANTERAFSTLTQAASNKAGNIQRLRDIYSTLTPQERTDMSASIIMRMGQGKNGFSTAKFLSDLAGMSDDAKTLLFRDQFGPDLLQAWDDLTKVVMPQIERATQGINRSNSGASLAQLGQAGLAVGTFMSDPVTAVAALVGPMLAAKMMTTPAAVRLLSAGISRAEAASSIAAKITALLGAQQAAGR